MVNYNRMEDVPRAYGPLEPIGPTPRERGGGFGPPPRRRASYAGRSFVVGLAAFVMAGGALGLYFRPNLEEEPARGGPVGPPPEPANGEGVDIMVAEAPGPVVMEAAPPPLMPVDVSYADIADVAVGPVEGAAPWRSASEPAVAEPEPAPGPFAAARRTFDRMTAQRQPPEPTRTAQARRPETAPALGRPMVVARNDTPVPVVPRRQPEPLVIARADPPRAVAEPRGAAPDCGGVRSAGARTVCENPEIAALDRRLAVEFERAVAAGHDRAALSLDHDSWLAKREAAAPDARAVAEAYERRIRQLRSMQ